MRKFQLRIIKQFSTDWDAGVRYSYRLYERKKFWKWSWWEWQATTHRVDQAEVWIDAFGLTEDDVMRLDEDHLRAFKGHV